MEVAKLLIKSGGKPIIHATTASGNSALDLARNYGREEVVTLLEKLLKVGPQPESPSLAGRPPWHDTKEFDNPYEKR